MVDQKPNTFELTLHTTDREGTPFMDFTCCKTKLISDLLLAIMPWGVVYEGELRLQLLPQGVNEPECNESIAWDRLTIKVTKENGRFVTAMTGNDGSRESISNFGTLSLEGHRDYVASNIALWVTGFLASAATSVESINTITAAHIANNK